MRSGSYDTEFFRAHQEGARRSARVIVPLLLDLVPCRSVLDVGCGLGTWLGVFREHGVDDVMGVDGTYVDPASLDIAPEHFVSRDLARPFALHRVFDLVISIEVAEHLQEECARGFIGSLVAHGSIILFSAAVPHQGGRNHINEQWPAYWASLFAEHGYVPIDCIRRKVWSDERVEWWYAQNLLVYVDRARLDTYPLLRNEHIISGGAALPLVHPHRYLEWVEWGLNQSRQA